MTDTYRMLASEVIITSSNNTIVFREDGSGTDRTATITPGSYYLDFSDDAKDLAKAIVDAMTAGSGIANVYNWTDLESANADGGVYASIGTSTTWTFHFAASTFPLEDVGFDPANTLTHQAKHFIGTSSSSRCLVTWYVNTITTMIEPSTLELEGAYHYRTPSGRSYAGTTTSPVRVWPCQWDFVHRSFALQMYQSSVSHPWEEFFRYVDDGRRVRIVHIDAELGIGTSTPIAIGRLTQDSRRRMSVERDSPEPRFRIECTIDEDMGA